MVIIYFSALQCKVQCKFTYFIKNGGMLIVFIKRDLFVAPINICAFTDYTTRRANRASEWGRSADVFQATTGNTSAIRRLGNKNQNSNCRG